MAKWNVHLGVRLTYDIEVEANTREEAIQKATDEWEDVNYEDMDLACQDVDAWEKEANRNAIIFGGRELW